MILEVFSLGPIETNSILLACSKTKKGAIVDTPFGCSEEVLKRARELKLDIQMVLLTHSHWDHIADAALVKKKLNVPFYVHAEDADNLKKPGSDKLPLFIPFEGVVPDHFLTDGQVLNLGELRIKVIHTPGHSPGCVCFYMEKEKTLISGDTLFRGTIGNLSLPTARPALMGESLKKLAALPPETRVYPGHGDETTIGAESWIKNVKSGDFL